MSRARGATAAERHLRAGNPNHLRGWNAGKIDSRCHFRGAGTIEACSECVVSISGLEFSIRRVALQASEKGGGPV